MSATASASPKRRVSVPAITKLKGERPIVALTAYVDGMTRLLDPHVDMLLVGDSLGMVLYGMESTLPVMLEDMIRHGETVVRASQHACVVVDMPFGSYQLSPAQAYEHAVRIMKETGAQAVKLEGGAEMAETVAMLTARAIPVMAHIGLKPQHVHVMGGYRVQGRSDDERRAQLADAKTLEAAGAFALLLEGLEASLAAEITKNATIPTIGIGAGPACDGQILVTEDMLGLSPRVPSFVRQFANLGDQVRDAVQAYAQAVTEATFPDAQHSYTAPDAK